MHHAHREQHSHVAEIINPGNAATNPADIDKWSRLVAVVAVSFCQVIRWQVIWTPGRDPHYHLEAWSR